jgi:hypothetical protein
MAGCMSDTYESRLLSAYPEHSWAVLIRGVREGVKIADEVRRSTPFLSTHVGQDLRGLLRRAAIMWRIQMLCTSGELSFAATEIRNTKGTSHLLSILSGNVELHVVRTEDVFSFPIEAPIRQDRRITNQPDLFEDAKIVPLSEALKAVPRLYGWLAWGATSRGELTHLCLAMPEAKEDQWLAHLNILHRIRLIEGSARSATPTPSAPNPALLLKFREEIARSLETELQEGGDGDAA